MVKHAQLPCPICGNSSFCPGPNGRISATGLPPQCARCGSLERHRVIRGMWEAIRPLFPLDSFACLQIADDVSMNPNWFSMYYLSVYGGRNSLDIQNIALPDGAVDIVVCNHVLEHVPDDRKALSELLRIVRPNGFLQLAVPSPLDYGCTEDWGYPDEKQHGHYRVYGQDVLSLFAGALPGAYLFSAVLRDFCTGTQDIIFLLSHKPITKALTEVFPRSHFQRLAPDSVFPAQELRLARTEKRS